MGIDDVNQTVTFVMWFALAVSASALALAWKAPSPWASRGTAAFSLGWLCSAYHVALLFGAEQPGTYAASLSGLCMSLATAALLAQSKWTALRSVSGLPARVASVVAAWSVLTVTLFALFGLGKP